MTDIVDDLALVAAAPNMHGPLAGWCGRAAFEITTLRKELAEARAVTPEKIAAAWAAWHSRHGGKLGPGPAFVEAIEAALRPPIKAKGEKR